MGGRGGVGMGGTGSGLDTTCAMNSTTRSCGAWGAGGAAGRAGRISNPKATKCKARATLPAVMRIGDKSDGAAAKLIRFPLHGPDVEP